MAWKPSQITKQNNQLEKLKKEGLCFLSMGLQNFKHRYCEMRGVTSDAFTKTFILETCYTQAGSFYSILLNLGETRIKSETDLLHDLAGAETLELLEAMINGVYFSSYLKTLGSFRKRLKLRLSGSKIVKVGQEVFGS